MGLYLWATVAIAPSLLTATTRLARGSAESDAVFLDEIAARGWAAVWMARHFRNAEITAVSHSQRVHIEPQAASGGLWLR
jgi:hypothetical protein